jgi:hypothetical protein
MINQTEKYDSHIGGEEVTLKKHSIVSTGVIICNGHQMGLWSNMVAINNWSSESNSKVKLWKQIIWDLSSEVHHIFTWVSFPKFLKLVDYWGP